MIESFIWALLSELLNSALSIFRRTNNRRLQVTRIVVVSSLVVGIFSWILAARIDNVWMETMFGLGGFVSFAISLSSLVYAVILGSRNNTA